MNKIPRDGFLELFRSAIDADPDAPLQFELGLDQVEGWDSLAIVSLISSLSLRHRIVITSAQIRSCRTIEDIYRVVAGS